MTITAQFGPLLEDALETTHQQIDVETSFKRLIDDDGVVLLETRVIRQLREQDSIGHDLDHGLLWQRSIESDLESDERLGPAFLTEAMSDRSAASRLGCVCPIMPNSPRPMSRQILQLGRLCLIQLLHRR